MPHSAHEHPPVICLNCRNHFHGHFCNQCGQDAHTDKIDRHFLVHELQHALLHVDKGIFYTLKTLFSGLGYAIGAFIEGKRVKHFKPLMFLLVMAGLYAFVNHFVGIKVILSGPSGVSVADNSVNTANQYINEHFAWFVLLQLPLVAWVYYLFFRKYGTNYAEQLIICAYITGMRTLIGLLLLPLMRYSPVTGYVLQLLIPIGLFLWTYLQYYSGRPKAKIFFYTILGYACFYVLLLILISAMVTLLANT